MGEQHYTEAAYHKMARKGQKRNAPTTSYNQFILTAWYLNRKWTKSSASKSDKHARILKAIILKENGKRRGQRDTKDVENDSNRKT